MIPKLRVTVRESMLRARTGPGATASGCCHAQYFDARGFDVPVLATFPSDDEIGTAVREASEEADGVPPKRLQEGSVLGGQTSTNHFFVCG
jgi:hypothetical protein